MANKKISELSDFKGKRMLLLAQKEGIDIFVRDGLIPPSDATAVTLLGLVKILVEKGVLEDS